MVSNYKKYAKAKPEDFDIDPKYCLNSVTVNYFIEKNPENYSDEHIENMDFEELEIGFFLFYFFEQTIYLKLSYINKFKR